MTEVFISITINEKTNNHECFSIHNNVLLMYQRIKNHNPINTIKMLSIYQLTISYNIINCIFEIKRKNIFGPISTFSRLKTKELSHFRWSCKNFAIFCTISYFYLPSIYFQFSRFISWYVWSFGPISSMKWIFVFDDNLGHFSMFAAHKTALQKIEMKVLKNDLWIWPTFETWSENWLYLKIMSALFIWGNTINSC